MSSGVPGFGEFTVSAGPADYRLVADVTRNHPRMAAVQEGLGGVDVSVDLFNHARAGKNVTIPVTVDRQPGARGGKKALDVVEMSVDEGKTWQRVRPRAKDDQWVVTIRNPETGFVSLRANASDRAGNTVTDDHPRLPRAVAETGRSYAISATSTRARSR